MTTKLKAPTKAEQAKADELAKAEELKAEELKADELKAEELKKQSAKSLKMPLGAKQAVNESESTTPYQVNWQLQHDGKKYNTGDEVELTDEEVEPLKKTGVLVPNTK